MLPEFGHNVFNAFLVGIPTARARRTGEGMGCLVSSEEQHPATLQSFVRFDKASSRLLVSASMRWKGTLSSLVLACTHVPAQYLNPARQDSGFTFTAEDLAGNSPSE